LTSKQLRALARRVEDLRATTAGDIDRWRATAAVLCRLRHLRGSRAAAIAALGASEAVLEAPGAAGPPRDAVVQATRAAGDVAGVLVAGGPPFALAFFICGWEDAVGEPLRLSDRAPPEPLTDCRTPRFPVADGSARSGQAPDPPA
jgi:hypothetical protein